MAAMYQSIGTDKMEHASPKRIQWYRSPLGMIVSLLGAILLCIGHDQFYRRLDGQHITTALSQTWASRIATALAFLVSALLALAVSIAFVQRQWLVLRRNSVKIGHIDSLTSILHDLRAFADPYLWLKTPLLALAAVVAWLLPVIVMIAPSTLTVTSNCHSTGTSISIPQLSFDTYNYSVIADAANNNRWQQPSHAVARVAFATATTGEILAIPHQEQNVTYSTQFWGPTVQCIPANNSITDSVSRYLSSAAAVIGPWRFFAFVPGDVGMAPLWTPCDSSVSGSACTYTASPSTTIDLTSTDAARIWIMSAAENCQSQASDCYRNVIECSLHNATYDVTFGFSGTNQDTAIKSVTVAEPLAALPSASDTSARNDSTLSMSMHESYQSVMSAFGSLLVGSRQNGGSYLTVAHLTTVDWSDMSRSQSGLEQLFHNITLSLLSSPNLIAATNERVPVESTVTTCPTVYTYRPRDLYITYGISIIATLICVLIGMHALVTNQACYSNRFSTYIRTTRGLALKKMLVYDGKLDDEDCGQSPLPNEVRKMKVELGGPGSATRLGSSGGRGYSMVRGKNKGNHGTQTGRRHDALSMFQEARGAKAYGRGGAAESSRDTRSAGWNVQTSYSGGTMGMIGQNMSRYGMI